MPGDFIGERVMRFQNKAGETMDQNVLLEKLPSIVKWMQNYEQDRYSKERALNIAKLENALTSEGNAEQAFQIQKKLNAAKSRPEKLDSKFLTQPFLDENGLCVAFGGRIVEAAMAHNLDGFVRKSSEAINATFPPSEDKKEAFYKKMNLFITEMVQMQAFTGRAVSGDIVKQGANVINEASDAGIKVRNTCFFTKLSELLEWAQKAEVPAALSLKSEGHQMAIYIDQDENGRKIVGFYDSDHHEMLEYYQDSLIGIPDEFKPFDRARYPSLTNDIPVLFAEEIVSKSNFKSQVIADSADVLNQKQREYIASFVGQVGTVGALEKIQKLNWEKELFVKVLNDSARFHNHEVLNKCLKDGVVDNLNTSTEGLSPIYYAAEAGNLEAIKSLIEAGADPQQHGVMKDKQVTLLHCAAANGRLEVMQFLINECKSDPHAVDSDGATLIHYAAKSGDLEVMKYLITKGANVNAVDINGNTAVYYASGSNYEKVVKLLRDAGVEDKVAQIVQNNHLSQFKYEPPKIVAPYEPPQIRPYEPPKISIQQRR